MMKQFEKKHLKQFENQSQSGRSMIEMLGVLAIIAILSIGGIVGFRLAMNYYQANQIAHEVNLMRTDAQIKIAQGTEKLTLGDPYDSGNIQFNGYKTDFDCLYLETETSTPDKVVSCAVANAYYIELQEIPEGVCKPLANLIDKMDNEIAFYINGKSVDAAEGEKGICLGEENILTVIFGADSDSEAIKCNDDPDCPDNLICLNYMCVECETDEDCTTDKPKCEQSTNTCKSCAEIDPNKPLWADNECKACPENELWNGKSCGCRNNDDCGANRFCQSKSCNDCHSEGSSCIFECVQINNNNIVKGTINGNNYYGSSEPMNWWSAQRFCMAAATMAGGHGNMASWGNPDFKCAHEINPGVSNDNGYCHIDQSNEKKESNNNNVSQTVSQLRSMYGDNDYFLWLQNNYSSCVAYGIHLRDGYVLEIARNYRFGIDEYGRYAFCE